MLNRMIEEYMLLANMAVARKIYKSFPEKAVLRRHPEPQGKQLSDLEVLCQSMGLNIDTTSSNTMQVCPYLYSGYVLYCTNYIYSHVLYCTNCIYSHVLYCTNYIYSHVLYCTNMSSIVLTCPLLY